jgi:hypothetical protein
MKTFMVVAFAMFGLMDVAAHADNAPLPSVQQLRDSCKKPGAPEAFCLGFLEAIGQMMALNSESLSVASNGKAANGWIAKTSICLKGKPLGSWPSGGAMEAAFVNWADQNPQNWDEGATPHAIITLRSTWPCPNSN